jgi:hypothetical protein
MAGTYTIEQWLSGMVDFNVPEATLSAILFNNSVAAGTAVSAATERQRDLCLADLYMWLAASSSSSSGEYISDGGWQHQKSNKNVVDRAGLRAAALRLYLKWDSDKADTARGNVTIKHLYK